MFWILLITLLVVSLTFITNVITLVRMRQMTCPDDDRWKLGFAVGTAQIDRLVTDTLSDLRHQKPINLHDVEVLLKRRAREAKEATK